MEVKIDKNRNIVIKHLLKKSETYKISKGRKFTTISIYKKPQIAKGVSSYFGNGKHCLFIDFDNCPLWLVEEDFYRLQALYGLPPSYLFYTSKSKENGEVYGNFHIICLNLNYPNKVYEMLSKTHADINFMSMPLRRRWKNWTLRISTKKKKNKPKYMGIIGEIKNLNKEVSGVHLKFLKKIYDLDNIDYKNINTSCKEIFLQEYQTS